MLYTVEVRLIGREMIGAMSEMRTWLDHHRFEPDAFRFSRGSPTTTFRLDFKLEDEAMAFAQAFEGRVLGSSPLSHGQMRGRDDREPDARGRSLPARVA